jgi:ubiquinone/menaquinone biosynthesis C-methylase UbiE
MEMQGIERAVLASHAWKPVSQRVLVPFALALADLPTEAEVLQLGCGAGFETVALADRYPHWQLTATDYDPDMVELARRRLSNLRSRVIVQQADATGLGYEDSSFDIALALLVWHHVGDWRKATAESARVLRPGGCLVLMDLLDPVFAGPLGSLSPPHGTYGLEELRSALAAAGFARYRVRGGRFWYRLVANR